ncbi:hypothetical protein [Oligella urethralis]|uniref:Uncharacterized protein n=1 Tax=Oligella urethralis TaxID=90245 RepID=A0A2X1UUF0_9BURK|nr:hypothetical protein [Oligella urethralis]SPY08041.1 Uncharacterised protein [Oligella urethralis]
MIFLGKKILQEKGFQFTSEFNRSEDRMDDILNVSESYFKNMLSEVNVRLIGFNNPIKFIGVYSPFSNLTLDVKIENKKIIDVKAYHFGVDEIKIYYDRWISGGDHWDQVRGKAIFDILPYDLKNKILSQVRDL